MRLTVKVSTDLVRQGLENLKEGPRVGRRRMRTVMDRIKRIMQAYPAEPSGQSVATGHPVLGKIYKPAKGRYRRTGRLGHSWVINNLPDGYTIENNAARKGRPYAAYVVGDAYGQRQAKIHRGRWPVFRDVADKETANLPQEILDDLQMVARRSA
jgi:hypothetical protein